MASSSHKDADPEGRHVRTDPGISPGGGDADPAAKKSTDPGIAPPLTQTARLAVVETTAPIPPPVVAAPAVLGGPGGVPQALPARQVIDASPELPPASARLGGDPTPVPAEMTDGLLSGLIASESEAYFGKAKAASASSGEAAVAFHGPARAVAPGAPTQPPEPPVMLRRSIEMDIVAAARGQEASRQRLNDPNAVTDPMLEDPRRVPTVRVQPARAVAASGQARVERDVRKDETFVLPETESRRTVMIVAAGVAVLALIGALAWMRSGRSEPAPSVATAPVSADSVAVSAPIPLPSIPPPPVQASATPAETAATAVPAPSEAPLATSAEAQPTHPTKGPRAPGVQRTTPRATPSAGSPPEVLPPAKDDVKRSM